MSSLTAVLNLPEWYVNEKETVKTIEKLANLKELDYYLSNPDEYIRRQAIIRLSSLKLKESENKLREVLDDHLESNANKNLAAWALRVVYSKLKTELLINSKYLSRFTGNETLDDLFPLEYEDAQPSIKLDFSSNNKWMQLSSSQDELYNIRSSGFESNFNFTAWLQTFGGSLLTSLKTMLLTLGTGFIRILKSAFISIFVKAPSFVLKTFTDALHNKPKRIKPEKAPRMHKEIVKTIKSQEQYINSSKVYYNGKQREIYDSTDMEALISRTRAPGANYSNPVKSIAAFFKKVVFNMLYVFLLPVRVFFKHKFAVLAILGGFYIFFCFTSPGRILFNSYFGKDLQEIQNSTASDIKQTSVRLWEQFMDYTSLDKVFNKTAKTAAEDTVPASTASSRYSVTASKGLNIRKAPDASSEKLAGGSLPFKSIVTYLNKQSKDASGTLWYYIEANDGRSGWVSKKFLKKEE